MMKNLLWVVCFVIVNGLALSQSTYRAAVVEYAPKISAETYSHRLLENVQEYINYISEAADEAVDIIVFPENGLTGLGLNETSIRGYSIEIPDSKLQITPCDNQQNYSKVLIDLSCAAQTHRLYVVVNVVERRNRTGTPSYYNTNIVFNRNGVLIASYSKINLYDEAFVKPGNETVTFTTDFGVTFGMFICNDIVYRKPALDLVADLSVTDIIFSTAWFSKLPFGEALSKQHGYVVTSGVNFLAAGLNFPKNTNGGSAIYFSNGTIAEFYKSGAQTSKMIIASVPKITRTNITKECQTVTDVSAEAIPNEDREYKRNIDWGILPSIANFKTLQQDMSNFTFKSIRLSDDVSEQVCSGNSNQFCCSINLTTSISNTVNYAYKLVVYNGGLEGGGKSMAVRTCALVACLNNSDSLSSCGLRHSKAPEGVLFKTLSLKASFPKVNGHEQPSTVNYDLQPLTNYTFCKRDINNNVELTLSSVNQSSLLTFGVFGRVFDYDNKGSGAFNSATTYIVSPYTVFILSIITFLLQE